MSYRPTIGLEIHAELKTKTKMFCNSKNDPDEVRANVNICPICLAHPGTLPTINKEAVRHVVRIGTAVEGTIADYTEFDRKSYFYPDIPKGFQISQYEFPLVKGGKLAGVELTRVHLEEDTARSTHDDTKKISLVDFNRAGIPLMELVTEPVIHDAETAGSFARELQLLLRTLGASDANLEKGEMRIEANVSVSKDESFGTKVEIKNLNSFRSVERAIAYEVNRQIKALEKGETLVQETRGWDEDKGETFHQRFKEGSADYRYFPEPDLPKLVLSEMQEFSAETVRASLPELPGERRARYKQLSLKPEDIGYLMGATARSVFFDTVASLLSFDAALTQLAVNYLTSDLAGYFAKQGVEAFEQIAPEQFAEIMRMISRGDLSSRGGKDVLAILLAEGGDAASIARDRGLIQVSDTGMLEKIVDTVLAGNEAAVKEYKAGKEAALQYLLGQAMKESRGAGNPQALREILKSKLG